MIKHRLSCLLLGLALLVAPLARGASEKRVAVERHLLKEVLQPWISAHHPKFKYAGTKPLTDALFSWIFHDPDGRAGLDSGLEVRLDFYDTEKTARQAIEPQVSTILPPAPVLPGLEPVPDATLDPVSGPGAPVLPGLEPVVPAPESLPQPSASKIGDETVSFDAHQQSEDASRPETFGGLVACRVGTSVFSVKSGTLRFAELIDLAKLMVAELAHLPNPRTANLEKTPSEFLKEGPSLAYSAPRNVPAKLKAPLEQQVFNKVLQPWLTEHRPHFEYQGEEPFADTFFSWSFHDQNGEADANPALTLELDACLTPQTAHRTFTPGAWLMSGLDRPGVSRLELGDEAVGFDRRKGGGTPARPQLAGGWVMCRIGSYFFVLDSTSLTFAELTELARCVAREIPRLPAVPNPIRSEAETSFLTGGRDGEIYRHHAFIAEMEPAMKFATAREYASDRPGGMAAATELAGEEAKDRTKRDFFTFMTTETPVTEISMERTGCFGTCPVYAVLFHGDGRVEYFGRCFVQRLGSQTGHISVWAFRELAAFVQDAKVQKMQDDYSAPVTDSETVYTSFVIGGVRKTISDYAGSAPASLWAIEELIDKLLSDVEWDAPKPAEVLRKTRRKETTPERTH